MESLTEADMRLMAFCVSPPGARFCGPSRACEATELA